VRINIPCRFVLARDFCFFKKNVCRNAGESFIVKTVNLDLKGDVIVDVDPASKKHYLSQNA